MRPSEIKEEIENATKWSICYHFLMVLACIRHQCWHISIRKHENFRFRIKSKVRQRSRLGTGGNWLAIIALTSCFMPQIGFAAKASHESFRGTTLIPKLGGYKFQYPNKEEYLNSQKPNLLLGFEIEWRFHSGFAIGVDYFHYKNDVTDTASGVSDEVDVNQLFGLLKYYFNIAPNFKFFVGAGLGFGKAKVDGVGKSYSGDIYQYTSGLAYVVEDIEIQFQYKNVQARIHESGLSTCILDCGGNIDVSGNTLILGVGVRL